MFGDSILSLMNRERMKNPERKEGISDLIMKGAFQLLAASSPQMGKIFSYADYYEKNEEKIAGDINGAFDQIKHNPDLFAEIAAGTFGDVASGYNDEQRKRTEERTKIHLKAAGLTQRFKESSTVRKEADKHE